jgi:hypothetical protein
VQNKLAYFALERVIRVFGLAKRRIRRDDNVAYKACGFIKRAGRLIRLLVVSRKRENIGRIVFAAIRAVQIPDHTVAHKGDCQRRARVTRGIERRLSKARYAVSCNRTEPLTVYDFNRHGLL